jgi:quinoprotein glucose dehydrogenase
LLQAIVVPNHAIAEGFETRVLALDDGQIVAGIVKQDDGKTLVLMTPEAKTLQIARERIEEERRGDSAMPADLVQKLTQRELRDLLEFLATGR